MVKQRSPSLRVFIGLGMLCGLMTEIPLSFAAEEKRKGLEEVVVTAQKQEEAMQNVPVAISAFDQSSLERMQFTDMKDLTLKVPSLGIAIFPTNNSTLTVFLRGIGSSDVDQISRDPGVGIYVDDIYLGRAQGLATDVADIERIEVLRGPQGVLYGRNTIGGAIKYVTAKPTGDFGLRQSFSYGNWGYVRNNTNLNLPKAGGVSAKFSYVSEKQDGLVSNPGEGDDFGKENKMAYRLALLANPSDVVTLEYAYDYSQNEGTSRYGQQVAPNFNLGPEFWGRAPINRSRLSRAIRGVNLPIKDDYDLDGHTLTVTWDAMENLTFKSLTSYRQTNNDRLHDTVEGTGYPILQAGATHQRQYSQEFVFNGSLDSIKYVAGLYYFREDGTQRTSTSTYSLGLSLYDPAHPSAPGDLYRPIQLSDLPPYLIADVTNKSQAIYANITWVPHFLEKMSVSLGGRYSRDQREQTRQRDISNPLVNGGPNPNYVNDSGHADYSSTDPALTIDYRWTESFMTYAKASTAYRAGGFNVRTARQPFGPEHLTAYEIGLKSMWFDDRVRFNLAGYYSKYRDIQTEIPDAQLLPVTINAGDARIKGVEVELTVLPIENLQVQVDYSFMSTKRDDYVNPYTGMLNSDIIMGQTPKNKVNVDAEYKLDPFDFGQLSFNLNYGWTAEFASLIASKQLPDLVGSYGLFNANITLAKIPVSDEQGRGDLSVMLWGKNLADKDWAAYAGSGLEIYGQPRSYGITATYNY